MLNSLLHDTSERLRQSQHIETIVSHHCFIRLIVSYNLAQQQSSWEELIVPLKGGLALPSPNPILKRKRTTLARNIPQKRRQSTRLRTKLGAAENPQGSINQPIELSSPGTEQYLQLEGRDDPESDHEEEIGHSRDEERNESGSPLNTKYKSPTRLTT